MDSEDETYHYPKLKTKGKSNCLPELNHLELKLRRRRQGKCVGAALEFYKLLENKLPTAETSNTHRDIITDIWFHLANYIDPEDIQVFSMICSESAKSINFRTFWLQLYRRHCHQTDNNMKLPEDLQLNCVKNCNKNILRQKVIQALFYCHPTFKRRLQTPYKLETLAGRTHVSSWYKIVQCDWIMCFKFKLNIPITKHYTKKCVSELEKSANKENIHVVDDWECLADEKNNNFCNVNESHFPSTANDDLDGVSLLVIYCDRFIPLPSDIMYNHDNGLFRLSVGRELLSSDMRSINLELDFISNTRDKIITVTYTKIKNFRVLPWWHPDFRTMNTCE